jgi:hypothetical protein
VDSSDFEAAQERMVLADPVGAEAALRRLLHLAPNRPALRYELSRALIAQGKFAEGWPLFEARETRRASAAHTLPFPEWQGEPLAGKRLLVWREQGFGDQIQMARFLPRLGAQTIVYAGLPQLERLFQQLPLDYAVVGSGGNTLPACHYWTLPFSLPTRLGLAPETIPTAPYLAGRPRATGGRIGLAWRGNAQPDPSRSLSPEAAARLQALPGAVSLHPEESGAVDFQDTADLVAGLDLVISVDTSVAHLAGAMGKPVWLLLPALREDFRWMTGGTRSPWYPSMRLFRQPQAGDWDSVVNEVLGALA